MVSCLIPSDTRSVLYYKRKVLSDNFIKMKIFNKNISIKVLFKLYQSEKEEKTKVETMSY